MNRKRVLIGVIATIILVGLGWFTFHDIQIANESKQVFTYSNLDQIKQILAAHPNDPVALRSMAEEVAINHDYPGAIQYLEKSLQYDPQNRYSQFQLAYYLLFVSRPDQARPILTSLSEGNDDVSQDARNLLQKTRGKYTFH